jgi:hypothetical protein
VDQDTTVTEDVFVASSGTLALVSKNGQGLAADSDSFNPSVSGDGQAIVFESFATDLVTGFANGWRQVYVARHDV